MGTEERRWRDHVCAILRRGGASRDYLEDLCQDVAIAYFRTRGTTPWEDSSPQPSLVAHLIKSVLSDYFAQLRRHMQVIGHYTSHVALTESRDDLATEREAVSKLHELPPNLREIIEMKVFCGYTFSEISDLTSCPEGTIKARYYKGLAILRDVLQKNTTFSSCEGINNMDTNEEEVWDQHVSENGSQDAITPDGRCGGGYYPFWRVERSIAMRRSRQGAPV